ncbi:unnamed protein product [Diabrotica balteata]|uniref:Uncharacterized protein n=1 Tax=Diabrotica balteata TaxID=107213 RepID=A0A9N9SZQ7_DIABA|nr:unnamed protein product [Diabrotica balteata]
MIDRIRLYKIEQNHDLNDVLRKFVEEYSEDIFRGIPMHRRSTTVIGTIRKSTRKDPDRSCRVACQDALISHRFYLVNGEDGWFPFGTDCSKGMPANKKAYCVSGNLSSNGLNQFNIDLNNPVHISIGSEEDFHPHVSFTSSDEYVNYA